MTCLFNAISGSLLLTAVVTTHGPPHSYCDLEAKAREQLIESTSGHTLGARRALRVRRTRELIVRASGLVESVGEAGLLFICHLYGLPIPEIQFRIDVEGRTFYADFAWPDHHLIVEFDGEGKFRKATDPTTKFAAELERQSLVGVAGYRVLRFRWQSLAHPQIVATHIARALGVQIQVNRALADIAIGGKNCASHRRWIGGSRPKHYSSARSTHHPH